MTVPNIITLFRLLLVPVFIAMLLYYRQSALDGLPVDAYLWAALAVFLVAAVSDGIDGWLARRLGQSSALGAMLDPLADKALMLSALVILGFLDMGLAMPPLPIWFLVLVLGRDVFLVLGYMVLDRVVRNVRVRPHWTGKAATVFLMGTITLVLLKVSGFWLHTVVAVASLLTLASLLVYLWRGCHDIQASGYH